jgi:putative membrane protein
LATGIARVYHEKGLDYYLESHVFWTKIALFIIMAIASLYPTILFIKAKTETDLSVLQYAHVKKTILAQILLVPGIIFMAIWMARGMY